MKIGRGRSGLLRQSVDTVSGHGMTHHTDQPLSPKPSSRMFVILAFILGLMISIPAQYSGAADTPVDPIVTPDRKSVV